MSDESPRFKHPALPRFSGLSLDEALAIADAPRDPVFGLQFSQIIASHLPNHDYPGVNFQCGIDPFRVVGLIYREPQLKLSQIHTAVMASIPWVGIDTLAYWLQEFRDANLIKGNPAEGFSLYVAPLCNYTFQPSGEDSDQDKLASQ